jgi:hypothetical protein
VRNRHLEQHCRTLGALVLSCMFFLGLKKNLVIFFVGMSSRVATYNELLPDLWSNCRIQRHSTAVFEMLQNLWIIPFCLKGIEDTLIEINIEN